MIWRNAGNPSTGYIGPIMQSSWRGIMPTSDAYETAKKRVEAKMSFYTHLTVYVAVILLLAIIDLTTSSGTIWFHWPMLGWGVAIVLHAVSVFVFPGRLAVTEEMIEKEMGKSRT
jgi:hypothetical protein